MKRLYFTADDYGISEDINRAIYECCRTGPVRNISVTVSFDSFDSIDRRLLTGQLDLSFGLHFTLTQGRPSADRRKVSTLLTEEGNFYPDRHRFFTALTLRKISLQEIEYELDAQIQKYRSIGFPLDFLNSHEHIHMHPLLFPVLINACKRYNINFLRLTREPVSRLNYPFIPGVKTTISWERMILSWITRKNYSAFYNAGLSVTDYFIELSWVNNPDIDVYQRILSAVLSENTSGQNWEICCHPGNGVDSSRDQRQLEYIFLTQGKIVEELKTRAWLAHFN